MGAGRQMETVVFQNYPQRQLTCNGNPLPARNLSKNELAGMIFGCKHSTFKECLFKQLFGLPAPHFQYVQKVTQGLPLFLFNYSDRTLHGIFEAVSAGQMYINQYAWTLDGQNVTPYPAQVHVKIHLQCQALTEDQFKPILARNYLEYEPSHLMFELDHAQTERLISLFSASPISRSLSVSPTSVKWDTLFRQSDGEIAHREEFSSELAKIDMNTGSFSTSTGITEGKQNLEASLDRGIMVNQENGRSFIQEKPWSSLFKEECNPSSKKDSEGSNSEDLSTMSEDDPNLSEATCIDKAPVIVPHISCEGDSPSVASQATFVPEHMSTEELQVELQKLIHAMGDIKKIQIMQTKKIQRLELELEEAVSKLWKSELSGLYSGCSMSTHSAGLVDMPNSETHIQDSDHRIILVGGFDGTSWLQNIDTYNPYEDVLQPLVPMKFVRSYASAVELNDNLYVLGGGYGSSWYDTVDSFNLKSHEWIGCPSLNRKKGSLAGASLLGKIFAVGGGNATDCFSEVEVLDLNIGKWNFVKSMLEKRFAPAVAELNGVLYVAGGYDGKEYLRSVERYDPRAYSWTALKSMHSRRGCHSLTVLNEKLYVIGGYDGTKMVPTMEVFDPRMDSWIMSESMKYPRGYLGAVTYRDKIYAAGGMQKNNEILDTVECYSEEKGWELTRLKSVGRRCFFSAVVV